MSTVKRPKTTDVRKISSIILLSLLLFFLPATPALSSSDWLEYSKDEDGNIYSYKVNKVKGKQFVEVWDQKAFSKEGRRKHLDEMTKNGFSTAGYEKLSTVRVLVEFDCKKKMSKGISVNMFDASSKVLYSMYYDNPAWTNMLGDSIWDVLFKEVCQ